MSIAPVVTLAQRASVSGQHSHEFHDRPQRILTTAVTNADKPAADPPSAFNVADIAGAIVLQI